MTVQGKHRILLVNFSEQDASSLTKAGFNVEVGYVGMLEKRGQKDVLPYYFPRPLYEYEIYIYNSEVPSGDASVLFPVIRDLMTDHNMSEHLANMGGAPAVRIAFTGGLGVGFKELLLGGLPTIRLRTAHKGVSELWCVTKHRTFQIAAIDDALCKLKKDIAFPIRHYTSWPENPYPFYHLPAILTLNGDEIASYGSLYSQTFPPYIVLPQMKNNVAALLLLLEVLVTIGPELFPDINRRDWYDSDEFTFEEEKTINQQVEAAIKQTRIFLDAKAAEAARIRDQYAFIKEILIAKEDGEPDTRLSKKIRQVLEFLGFVVEDIDEKIKGAIRKEDFWVKDEGFIAITEVTGTKNKNPKLTEYNDLLGRMTTIFKRRDLVPDANTIQGLLIINYDIDTHPSSRPRLYIGDAEEIVRAAKDQDIGLLSTVELYKIAIAVKDGVISKEEAKFLVRQTGRIEYTLRDQASSQT